MATESKARKAKAAEAPQAAATIVVIGVGGGGCNSVMRMVGHGSQVPGVSYICVNTDIKSLQKVEGAKAIQIGGHMTHGLGAGGVPDVGAQAAEAERDELLHALGKPDLVFLTAGMGGGTGTGAAPVVADIAKQTGALVIAVVTTPFTFEGARRLETAHAGISRLKDKVDNLIVIHNDRLLKLMKKEQKMEEALKMADEAVMSGILSVAEVVNVPGEINVDFADVKAIAKLPGHALMAIGQGTGEGGSLAAATQAVTNPLLNISIDQAKGVLFNMKGGPNLTLGEVNSVGEFINSKVAPDAIIFFGMVTDPTMGENTRITIIATGIPDVQAKRGAFTAPMPAQVSNQPK